MKINNIEELKNYIIEQIQKEMKSNPCWDGYEMIGNKKKKGKTVPNCVPKKESIEECDCENSDDAFEDHYEGDDYAFTLNGLADKAEELADVIEKLEEMPSWVQDKITSMDNDMEDIYDYILNNLGYEDEYAESGDDDYENWDEEDMDEAHSILEKWGKLEWTEISENINESEVFQEAEYQGRKVQLGKIMAGDVKKFKVYVKNDKGRVVKVNFGQKGVKIKKNNPKRRKSFRARHKCSTPGPRWKARYWSCKKW